jgi:predicted PurR-regulated permease PerM
MAADVSKDEKPVQLRRAPEPGRTAETDRAAYDERGASAERFTEDERAERAVNTAAVLASAAEAATIGIFMLLFFVFLEQARVILVPLVAAVVIGSMLGPPYALLRHYAVPSWLSALLVTGLFLFVVNLAITLMAAPVIDWIGKAPEIGNTIREKLQVFDRPLAALRELQNAIMHQGGDGTLKVSTGAPDLIAPALTVVTPAIGQLLLFVGALFFFLLSRDGMRRWMVSFFHDRDARLRVLRILNDLERSLTQYLSIVAVINVCLGLITGLATFLIGLPSFYVWAVLAFVLNFVPYIGPAIMIVVLLGVGVVSFSTLTEALIAPALYLAMATLEGHFITPSIIGRTLTLNPLMVFLALAFWTWIWGPVGAFLAVPLLIAALVPLHHIRPRSEANIPG